MTLRLTKHFQKGNTKIFNDNCRYIYVTPSPYPKTTSFIPCVKGYHPNHASMSIKCATRLAGNEFNNVAEIAWLRNRLIVRAVWQFFPCDVRGLAYRSQVLHVRAAWQIVSNFFVAAITWGAPRYDFVLQPAQKQDGYLGDLW